MSTRLAVLIGMLIPTLLSAAHAGAPDHRIWMGASHEGGRLLVTPRVEAGHEAQLSYELTSTKIGRSGRSESRQAGAVRVKAGETRPLTRLQLSVSGSDTYILSLRLYEEGRLVAEDSLSYPD